MYSITYIKINVIPNVVSREVIQRAMFLDSFFNLMVGTASSGMAQSNIPQSIKYPMFPKLTIK